MPLHFPCLCPRSAFGGQTSGTLSQQHYQLLQSRSQGGGGFQGVHLKLSSKLVFITGEGRRGEGGGEGEGRGEERGREGGEGRGGEGGGEGKGGRGREGDGQGGEVDVEGGGWLNSCRVQLPVQCLWNH